MLVAQVGWGYLTTREDGKVLLDVAKGTPETLPNESRQAAEEEYLHRLFHKSH